MFRPNPLAYLVATRWKRNHGHACNPAFV